jgi:hypothetical protein
VVYHRQEDVRAGHRGLAVPVGGGIVARRLGNGVVALDIPRG